MTDNIISTINYVINEKGINTYISPIFENTKSNKPQNNLNDVNLVNEIIDDIKYIEGGLGLFSSKYMDYCEFQKEFYDCIILEIINVAKLININFPYNSIQIHPNNQYKFDCLEQFFKMEKKILLFNNNSFPKVINIKRSSGIIQKCMINSFNSFNLYKSSQDNYESFHLGLKVGFYNDNTEIDENTIYETLPYTKNVLLKDILILNPEIKNINFIYSLIDVNKYDNFETFEKKNVVQEVIKHFNNIYTNWINETINNNFNNINCNITIEKV